MKIQGVFCEQTLAPKSSVDKRSFRWKKSGNARLLIGCPRGRWNAETQTCKVSTKAVKLLRPAAGRCSVGKRIVK